MFTLVAFRIMPLLQTMITNLLIIGGTHEYLREIYDLQKLNENLVNNNSIDPINKFNLTIKNLILYNTFLINGSIAFEKNICYKIEGKSGEGKSSLIYTILGLVINEDLKLIINDTTEISRQNIYAYRKKIAWLSQDNYIPNGTVLEFLDTDILQSNQFYLIKLFGIEDLFNEINIENRLGERGCNLSGGQIQKLILLKYLFNIKNYDILILDEATSAIDITTANLIYEYLLNNCTDKIIIVISHQTELNVFKNFIKIYAADFCKPINK
jgi:ABC-type transport system involved in cytochrome bd biosynthesis fused ATPase/permease subunit